jgi:hypothetical protein
MHLQMNYFNYKTLQSGPTVNLWSRLSLGPSNGTISRFSFHIRGLLVILSTPHLTLYPRTLHNLAKPTHCFLNRLPLTQHDFNQEFFSCNALLDQT